MAEHHIGHSLPNKRLHNAAQGVHISNENLSAIASGHMAQVLRRKRFPCPTRSFAHPRNRFLQGISRMGVAHDMLRHSVHDLNDAPNIEYRNLRAS